MIDRCINSITKEDYKKSKKIECIRLWLKTRKTPIQQELLFDGWEVYTKDWPIYVPICDLIRYRPDETIEKYLPLISQRPQKIIQGFVRNILDFLPNTPIPQALWDMVKVSYEPPAKKEIPETPLLRTFALKRPFEPIPKCLLVDGYKKLCDPDVTDSPLYMWFSAIYNSKKLNFSEKFKRILQPPEELLFDGWQKINRTHPLYIDDCDFNTPLELICGLLRREQQKVHRLSTIIEECPILPNNNRLLKFLYPSYQ